MRRNKQRNFKAHNPSPLTPHALRPLREHFEFGDVLAVLRNGWPALCVLLLLTACGQSPPADALSEGRRFPPLTLTGFDGERLSVDSLRGRLVVLNVWATWCAPCREELPSLERLSRRLDGSRFAVIGMSVDSDAAFAQDYLDEHGVTFPNYIDLNARLAESRLGIRAYPDTFIISPHGELMRSIVGAREWDDPAMVERLRAAFRGDAAALEDV